MTSWVVVLNGRMIGYVGKTENFGWSSCRWLLASFHTYYCVLPLICSRTCLTKAFRLCHCSYQISAFTCSTQPTSNVILDQNKLLRATYIEEVQLINSAANGSSKEKNIALQPADLNWRVLESNSWSLGVGHFVCCVCGGLGKGDGY